MIIAYTIIAIFIAWIWVDYYRLIDVFESEKLAYFILTFLLGASSVFIVFGINRYFLDQFNFELTGEFFNDFLYSVLKVGVVEEFAKLVPFLILLAFFRKQLNEPIDYLAFICVSALGFSATENVLYFQEHGPEIISVRAILSTVGHMFDTALIGYGIIRYHFYSKKNGVLRLLMFFFLAALAHGFYDVWLFYSKTFSMSWIVTFIYFFITISIFADILNNALNNSSFFTYKKVIDTNKVAIRLLTYYGIVFLLQFVLAFFAKDVGKAIGSFFLSLFITGFIVIITCVRLSRLKLIQGRWNKIKLDIPFTISSGGNGQYRSTLFRIGIKGGEANEIHINAFYQEYFYIYPVSKRNSYIVDPKLAYIERKIFLRNDETFYVARIFDGGERSSYETVLLKAKSFSITMVNDKYPIVALLKIHDVKQLENVSAIFNDFGFREWAFLRPKNEIKA
jgi:RsiW-degrading membrane proteinase PrsW (M82 family)